MNRQEFLAYHPNRPCSIRVGSEPAPISSHSVGSLPQVLNLKQGYASIWKMLSQSGNLGCPWCDRWLRRSRTRTKCGGFLHRPGSADYKEKGSRHQQGYTRTGIDSPQSERRLDSLYGMWPFYRVWGCSFQINQSPKGREIMDTTRPCVAAGRARATRGARRQLDRFHYCRLLGYKNLLESVGTVEFINFQARVPANGAMCRTMYWVFGALGHLGRSF